MIGWPWCGGWLSGDRHTRGGHVYIFIREIVQMTSHGHDHQRRLVHEVVALRRDLLGLDAVDVPASRADIPPARRREIEAVLVLPGGFLGAVREPDGPFAGLDAYEVLDRVERTHPIPVGTVPVCRSCAGKTALTIQALGLPFRVVDRRDRICICRSESCNDDDLLLRVAVEVSGRPRLLVVGGNQYIDRAAMRMRSSRVIVSRDDFRVSAEVVDRVDGFVWARGMLGHKHSDRFFDRYVALPEAARPLRIDCKPSVAQVTRAIVGVRDELKMRVA